MQILKEENGQGSAELILLAGGIIVIAIVALIFYRDYVIGLGNATESDVQSLANQLNDLANKF
ncbi:class III signal peptide-containing protein [Methanobacterium oryzae]|uniref:class III signal peptide-containing protein n=1 Tax=Methanobacterium oryzae TaxID=69540 RepID=UPI003D1DCB3B